MTKEEMIDDITIRAFWDNLEIVVIVNNNK